MAKTKKDYARIVSRSRTAFTKWQKTSLNMRIKKMKRLAGEISKQKKSLAITIHKEEGKPMAEALGEVKGSVAAIRFYLKCCRKILKPKKLQVSVKGTSAFLQPEPFGVVLIITPWNFPLDTPISGICPALLAGNSVIVKPSEYTEKTAKKLEKIMVKIFPKDTVKFVYGDGKTGRNLVKSGVNKIVFTGSIASGKDVLRNASDTVTPVLMELGGKDAAIVCSDADISLAAKGIVWAAFFNAGQVCTSVERVFVHKKVAKKFLQKLAAEAGALKKGKHINPMINKKQFETVRSHVNNAVSKGAKIFYQGEKYKTKNYFPPTILTNVKLSMKIMREETFGPVIPVYVVKIEKEAVKLANNTIYGLGASVWSRNIAKTKKIAQELDTGMVWINGASELYTSCPWGGKKQSGYGKVLSEFGLLEFVNFKAIMVNKSGSKRNYWF